MQPPSHIDGARVLEWAWSDDPFGVVCASDGAEPIAIHGLAICRYDGCATVYRFSCDQRWECAADGDYESIDQAKARLPDQYRGVPAIWRAATSAAPALGGQEPTDAGGNIRCLPVADDSCRCRVCGLLQLEPPWSESGVDPTWTICDCCGTEFGYEDSTIEGCRVARAQWLARRGRWWNEVRRPPNWSLEAQLRQVPARYL